MTIRASALALALVALPSWALASSAPEAPAQEAEASIIGVTWQLAELNGEPVLPEPLSTLVLSEDGGAGGQGACNTYGGTSEVGDGTIAITEIFSTMMACDEPIMAQEQSLFAALEAAVSYTVEDGQLVLMDGGDTVLARFIEAAEEA